MADGSRSFWRSTIRTASTRLVLASAGATHTSKGIPLGMCLALVEKGYPRYFREHSIATGFSKAFIQQHPDKVEPVLRELLDNLTPIETFLRYVIGRQQSDTTSRLKDIRAPTLVLIGDDEDHGASSDATHMAFAQSSRARHSGRQAGRTFQPGPFLSVHRAGEDERDHSRLSRRRLISPAIGAPMPRLRRRA